LRNNQPSLRVLFLPLSFFVAAFFFSPLFSLGGMFCIDGVLLFLVDVFFMAGDARGSSFLISPFFP